MPEALRRRLVALGRSASNLVILTGAGISAESGIPTFRGKEGYWVVGSREYQPQEMATYTMFRRQPEAVWAWYLYRRGVCRAALPNAGHLALVEFEQRLGERFLLITQNVDGLHLRAGNSAARTYEVHGNIDYARCADTCGQRAWPLDAALTRPADRREPLLEQAEKSALRCPRCGGWARPHVLWFDECYDEAHFRYESALRAAREADLLLVAGTSGATNLPLQVGAIVSRRGATIVDINPEANPFSQLATRSADGAHLRGTSGVFLPLVLEALAEQTAHVCGPALPVG